MAQQDLRQEWELRIADYRSSGLTQTKWCGENDVKIHTLHYWIRKIENKHEHPPKWIPVTLDNQFDENNESINIKIGRASIEVKPGFDPGFLAEVVQDT